MTTTFDVPEQDIITWRRQIHGRWPFQRVHEPTG